MIISIAGDSASMGRLKQDLPDVHDYLSLLPINLDLIAQITDDYKLKVRINEVTYEEGCVPFCDLPWDYFGFDGAWYEDEDA